MTDIISFLSEHKRRAVHYNVAPRYSPGSPALVDRETAKKVALDEEDAYFFAMEGRYGAEKQQRAETEGLKGIVEALVETRKGWDILDLLTGDRFTRPFQ